jgi:RNA polymerase sigma-70 factor (ECF subfamily)
LIGVVDDHFERWYTGQHPRLITALTVIVGDGSLAAEVVDEAFARAYERWSRVGQMESPEGWTYRTAINTLRRRQRRRSLEHQLHLRRTASRSPVAAPADWSPEVWDAVRRLPPRERAAVALRYVGDLSTDDIAVAMGIAPGTVGATLHSARRRLAVALADPVEEVTDA